MSCMWFAIPLFFLPLCKHITYQYAELYNTTLCCADKASANHPFRLARAELVQAVSIHPSHFPVPPSVQAVLSARGASSSREESSDGQTRHLLLTDWGVPASTAARSATSSHLTSPHLTLFHFANNCRHYLYDFIFFLFHDHRYAAVGNVHSMFKWQEDCLSTDGGVCVTQGRNLIYSAVRTVVLSLNLNLVSLFLTDPNSLDVCFWP
jgi:hypothetical protein